MYRKVVVLLSVAVLGGVLTTGTTEASAAAVCFETTPVDSYAVDPALELSAYHSSPAQGLFSVGQSVIGSGVVVDSARFAVSGDPGIVGNAYVEIWSHTGTFGVDGLPDAILATSDVVDEAILTAAPTSIKFVFSGANRITLEDGTNYFVVVNLTTQGPLAKYGNVYYYGTYPSQDHPGTTAYVDATTSQWTVGSVAGALIFEVLGSTGSTIPCESTCTGIGLESSAYHSSPAQGLFSVGQSVIGTGVVVDSAKFSVSGDAGIVGNAYVEIWSHTGTFGVDGLPNTILATSNTVNESVLTTSAKLIKFAFTGANRITLVKGTNYFVVVNLTTQGAAGKFGSVYYYGTYPSRDHSGNTAYIDPCTSQWTVGRVAGALIVEVTSAPESGHDGPKGDGPKGDGPKGDGPKGDGPKGDGPKGDGPKGDGPKGNGPRGDGPRGDGPKKNK